MISNLTLDFVVNKEHNSISITREFSTPLPLVWDAYTKSEILDQWWAPKPWKAKTKSMDFREGGSWLYSMIGPEGEEHWSLAKYKTIQIKKRFSGLDAFSDEFGNINTALPQSMWDVTFTDQETLTLVEILINFDNLDQLEATIQMGFKEGMTIAMEGLDELLESLKEPA